MIDNNVYARLQSKGGRHNDTFLSALPSPLSWRTYTYPLLQLSLTCMSLFSVGALRQASPFSSSSGFSSRLSPFLVLR